MNKRNFYLPAAVPHPVDPETAPPQHPVAEATRHVRKCSICRHPERDAIEEAFLHWQSPNEIAADYDLPDQRPIHRHAYATGLYARRKHTLRFVLDNYLERVNEIQGVTPDAIIRAVCAYARITDDGEWVSPPREVIFTRVSCVPVDVAGHARMSAPLASHVPDEVAEHASASDDASGTTNHEPQSAK